MKPRLRCTAAGGCACRGFTLAELLLALLVTAIVAGSAVSNLQPAMRSARRGAALSALLQLELLQHRHHAVHGRYAESLQALGCRGCAPASYRLSLRTDSDGDPGFVLQAQPVGAQLKDRCGMLSIDHLGRREAAAHGCW